MFSQYFGMLQVRDNETSLPKRSGGTAHFRKLGGHWFKNCTLLATMLPFSLMHLFRHAETTVGRGAVQWLREMESMKNKQIVTSIFVSVQQQY